MPDLITLLRIAGLALWIIPAAALAPKVWHIARGRQHLNDDFKAALFFAALLFIGGLSRWLFAPGSRSVLIAVHSLTVLLAIYVIALVWARRGSRG